MATERLEPQAITASSGWTPAANVSDIQADPDSKSWTTGNPLHASNQTTSPDIHCTFPNPSGSTLTVGADLQEFRVQTRVFDSNTGTPTIRIELWENGGGVAIRASSEIDITAAYNNSAGQVVSFTWNANELSNQTGDDVEIKVFITKAGGGPSVKTTGDIGAVEWNVTYTEATTGSSMLTLLGVG